MPKAANGPVKSSPDLDDYDPLTELRLDPKNPRLALLAGGSGQPALRSALWTHGALAGLAQSLAQNGYFRSEPLIAVREQGKLVVVEGNRRLAAIQLLLSRDLREEVGATDLPKLSSASRKSLERVPAMVYEDRKQLWPFLGFRHVQGPRVWDSWSKAHYIKQVRDDYGLELGAIADAIGDKHQTVERLYRGLLVLEQAEQAGYDIDDRDRPRFAFSHLYTGLDYAGFQKHLGLDRTGGQLRVNPVPKARLGHLRELMVWLFGSRAENKKPVVETQNPDLKRLDDVLKQEKALSHLRAGVGLDVAFQLTKGEEGALEDWLTRARYDLTQARGVMLDGYKGQRQLRDLVQSISRLAKDLSDTAKRIDVESPQ